MELLIKTLKAMGEPTRLRILAVLSHFELTVTELVFILQQSQPRISRHLKLLVDAGLLKRYQEGSWVFHRLNDQNTQTLKLCELIDQHDPILLEDKTKLEAIKQRNAELAQTYFREQAKDWDTIRQLIGSDESIEQSMLDSVNKNEIDFMADLGTGTGRILEIFAPKLKNGVGFDLNHAMLNVARANLEKSKINHCQVRQSDIRALPLESTSVDLVTLHQVLHYLHNPIAVIQEAARILKPNGEILIVDYAKHQHEFLRSEHAHRRLGFSNSEVKFWCENNDLDVKGCKTVSRNNAEQGLNVMLWHLVKLP